MAPKPGKPQQQGGTMSLRQAADEWGVSLALIDALGLRDFFVQQFEQYRKNPAGFSEDAFMMRLRQQPSFANRGKAFIEDWQFELEQPQVWAQSVDADVAVLRDKAVKIGADLSDDALRSLAIQKRRGLVNDAQMGNLLAQAISFRDGSAQGAAGSAKESIKQWAIANGLPLTDSSVEGYVRRISAGDTTEDDVKAELRRTYLAGAYPAWADKIDAGYDPTDIFSPYLEYAKQLLEDDSITLSDPIMQKITQAVTPDGKPMAMPLYQAQQMIRKDDRWQRTNNAYGMYANVANDVLRTFGFQ